MLEDLGVNASQRAVLEALGNGETLTVPQIAKQFSVSRQHVQVLVNEMRTEELVSSQENPSHKRSPLIKITPKGKELFTAIMESERDLLNVLESSFSSTDIETSVKTLETLEELVELAEVKGAEKE